MSKAWSNGSTKGWREIRKAWETDENFDWISLEIPTHASYVGRLKVSCILIT